MGPILVWGFLCECLQRRLLRLARVWRERVFEQIRVIADATATFTNLCVRVHSYVRVLLQKNCGVITSQLSMLAPCVCVLGQFWERRGGCGVREGWGGGTGAVHFSPFKLNVTQTTPLAHAHTQAHTHFFLAENLTEENLQHLPKCVRVSKKKTQRNGKRSRNAQNAQKKYTIVPIWCCISEGEREPCLAAWRTPFELDCVCVCVCVSRPARQTY